MANEKVDDCQLCCENYESTRRPRSLQCGHSYCTECLDKLLQNEECTCPICNASIKATSASAFSINYALEKAISDLRDSKYLEVTHSQPKTRNHRLQKLIDHHHMCSRDLLNSAREVSEDLQYYADFLSMNTERHEEMADELEERRDWHIEIIRDIKKERAGVAETKEKVAEHIERLEAILPDLDRVAEDDDKPTNDAVGKATIVFGILADLLDKCKKEYPDPTIANALKLLKPFDNLYIEETDYEEELHSCSGYPDILTVSEKVNLCTMEEYFTARHLKTEPEEWRKKMKTGKVVAEFWVAEAKKYAKVTGKEDQVFLHCLRDGKPPQLNFLIKHSEIMSCLKEPKVVFLDIAWNGTPKGRVHIRLNEGSSLAECFLSLCIGDQGPTYLGKTFDKVIYPQSQTERISSQPYGGSFLNGKVTFKTVEFYASVNSRNASEGIVWMEPDYTFQVMTGIGRDCTYNRVFGCVIKGLKVLEDSAKRIIDGGGNIEIVDTGVVLNF